MNNASTTAGFTYDHTGLRVKKSVNGVDTLYTMNGKRITHIRKGVNSANDPNYVNGPNATRMHCFYDAQGRAAMIRYNGEDYAYLHNLQGDITGMMDMTGELVVQYRYDAWGRPIVTEGSLAGTLGVDNPFRYRGYVWDKETGLFVTPTRYYTPEWGRWLNADEFLGRVGGLLSHNAFSYCKGNPVVYADNDGLEAVDVIRWYVNVPMGDRSNTAWAYADEKNLKASRALRFITNGTEVTLTGVADEQFGEFWYSWVTYNGKGYWIRADFKNNSPEANDQELSNGAMGPNVESLQRLLGIAADGIYGLNTKAAVVTFQNACGLTADGKVGSKTNPALSAYEQAKKYIEKYLNLTGSAAQSLFGKWYRMGQIK